MTDAIDITTEQRKLLLALLRRFIPGVTVWGFGSRVKWTARPNSDLDLVVFTSPEQKTIVSELKDAIAESNIPFIVDLHVWDEIPERFHEIIRKEYIMLQDTQEKRVVGDLTGRRRYIPASEFCASVRDGTHDSPKPVSQGRRLITSRHIIGGSLELSEAYLISDEDFELINKRSKVSRWDVLISMIGTVGEACLIKDEPNFAIKNIGLFKTKSETDGRWLYYYLRSQEAQQSIHERSRGSTQQYIPLGALREFPILVLDDTEEQKAIVAVLTALDDKIESNRRMSHTLEALSHAIFRAWFVDFEPVKAKAAGAHSFPGMPQKAFDSLPSCFIESRIGLIPEGWELGCLGKNCEINALSIRKDDINGEIEYIDISSVTVGRLDSVQVVPYADAPSRARRRVRHGDTIWSCVRPNHRSYLFIHTPPDNRIVSTGFAVLSPRSFGPSFLYQLTIQPEFVDYLVSNADGSAYPAVRPDHFAVAEVIVPPSSLREAFEAVTMPCLDLIASSERECSKFATLRDYLIPKMLSGEVWVDGMERSTT